MTNNLDIVTSLATTPAYDSLKHKIASRDGEGGGMGLTVDAFGRISGHDDRGKRQVPVRPSRFVGWTMRSR